MRDPDLVVRAQQAAAELERAWDRWRTMHGLGTDPLPPVSSYVGYSMEEPWGQPRVVFGIDAREAEQLAALLDRHDCAGPVYASVASLAVTRTADTADARVAEAEHRGSGHVRVPTQAQAGSTPLERLPEPSQPGPLHGPLEPPAPAQRGTATRDDEPAPRARTQVQEPPAAAQEAPSRRESQDPEAAAARPHAFRPRLEPADYPDDDDLEPGPVLDEPAQVAEPSQSAVGWTRASRAPGGHAMARQKRAARGGSAKQESRDRSDPETMAADLAGWTAGELPGQASRC
jgi:hypothetical protein